MDLSRINTWKSKQLKSFIGGKDLFKADIHGRTALYYAIDNNNVRLVCELLNAGVLKNLLENEFPLHQAAKLEDTKIVKILLFSGMDDSQFDDRGNTPLYYAVEAGNIQTIKLFIKKKWKLMFYGKTGWKTPFYKAVMLNDVSITEYFISELKASFDLAILYSCIHDTIKNGNVDMLILLLDYMMATNTNNSLLFIPDIKLAIENKDLDLLRTLFKYDINIYSVNLENVLLDDPVIARMIIEKHVDYKTDDLIKELDVVKNNKLDEIISKNKELRIMYVNSAKIFRSQF
ncbi:ankyrin/nfkb inhibitor [Raccoonpox virus]|uniref:Ankyrin/NFkB inhibitor n=1 Tax=Raccoon poxvirus TaxID=10256 RepID=A0A0G3G2F4_RACVI|nr:Ankyrin/NFkB inhibitor [Raccoonpox virus]AKJ93662.1 Ankyrin/NFkB inhibitor [Raccoonpox virus]AOP31293.1 ankyrin/nfkb inhibitor [Raccoonpox virus]